jgi:hypothetical protein
LWRQSASLYVRRSPILLRHMRVAWRMSSGHGVLQSWFGIVRYNAFTWSPEEMWEIIISACMIMHNIIIETQE